ncbi:hypothetical protein [Paracoccus aminophilus]|uniref:Uncharacterized protein n=1 Tax=Paracoccus aminophilus JCM 7686 TaxID=1367847 RepID=S5Y0L6_PARAH|nr:hypothetical protein [Paracoccus aminophilus]AGT09275.1 hypothetical protein JCM7686_2196 [Paracoccus aminophilus JCM 7686]
MATTSGYIKIPASRLEQIKKVAEARGLSVADTLIHWIEREVEAGTISGDLPGVRVEVKAVNQVGITLDDIKLDPTRAEAVDFAKRLREIAAGHRLDIEERFAQVKRRGIGFLLTSTLTGKRFPMSSATAGAIANQIDRALA